MPPGKKKRRKRRRTNPKITNDVKTNIVPGIRNYVAAIMVFDAIQVHNLKYLVSHNYTLNDHL